MVTKIMNSSIQKLLLVLPFLNVSGSKKQIQIFGHPDKLFIYLFIYLF